MADVESVGLSTGRKLEVLDTGPKRVPLHSQRDCRVFQAESSGLISRTWQRTARTNEYPCMNGHFGKELACSLNLNHPISMSAVWAHSR